MPGEASSRGSSRGPPSTPDRSKAAVTGSGSSSSSIAPKSEYLRNALQARRAQHTPTPSPLETRPPPPPPPAQHLSEIKTPNTSPDIFAEFALTEEQTTPVSPIRRRRPSDVGPPRSKTNRELTNEIAKLKETLMTSNMRVELLKKDNRALHQDMTSAKDQLEQLEPLENENCELHAENNQLKLKVANMEEEIAHLRDVNDEHRKTNEELTAIASESAAHWSAHEFAIEEAAECIIKMEEEKALLSKELSQLKERVGALESTSPARTLVDGSAKYPLRVYSVDESRPSTSHFDSDYYSQPGSPPPPIKGSGESVVSFTPSERSKKFLDLTEERRRSARDLVKRMSAVSLKALRDLSPSSPPPEVPQIPAAFQQQMPTVVQGDTSRMPQKTPGRYRKGRPADAQSLMDAPPISPVQSKSVTPQAPVSHPDGLRGLYRPDKLSRSRTSNDVHVSSNRVVTPSKTGTFASRQQLAAEALPRVPSRSSSKRANVSRSSEHIACHTPRQRQSESSMRSDVHTPQSTPASASSEWEILPSSSSQRISIVSESDLTTEVDPREDKERWWRSMDRLTLSQVMAQSQQPMLGSQHANEPGLVGDSSPGKLSAIGTPLESLRSGGRKSKTAPSSAVHTPYAEKDFLFNAAETEEDFLWKARTGGPRRLAIKDLIIRCSYLNITYYNQFFLAINLIESATVAPPPSSPLPHHTTPSSSALQNPSHTYLPTYLPTTRATAKNPPSLILTYRTSYAHHPHAHAPALLTPHARQSPSSTHTYITMITSGFTHTPISQLLIFGTVLGALLATITDSRVYFHIQVVPHFWGYGQVWRVGVWQLCFTNSTEVLFAVLTFYQLRVLERLWGSRKFAVSYI
ncbi:hypothetical protein BDW02DRAFT_579668 [Decorospora gaudefroyi]|uniref:Uncharacterized protein n=1 Tax=Decorospora gaudefroyi TaxID=184978 RepID=A0A6A5KG71_9PLEO|nr:hypothetical protein BDW02DRAFT_579668 [Decorospora gaudefroyi]